MNQVRDSVQEKVTGMTESSSSSSRSLTQAQLINSHKLKKIYLRLIGQFDDCQLV